MYKNIFHNKKLIEEHSILNKSSKKIVDVNKLLNRVKLDEKDQILKKSIFFGFIILLIGTLGFFLSIIK
jgi:hypothetical protein